MLKTRMVVCKTALELFSLKLNHLCWSRTEILLVTEMKL